MSNSNKSRRKHNQKINTAHFLISRFLSSPFSLQFKLCGNSQSLLRHMGDLMDTNLSQFDRRECVVKITSLCRQAGMTDKPAKKKMDELIDKKIIHLVKKLETNKGLYILGEVFSVWENLRNCHEVSIGDLETSIGVSPVQYRSFSETHIYNTSYKTNYKTVTSSDKKSESYKQDEPSPLLQEFMDRDL